MAPIHVSAAKRPRAQTNDDVSRKARNKRPRPSTPMRDPSDPGSYSEAESRDPDAESESDQGDDDADEEREMFRATQSVQKHLRASEGKQNTAAEQGIIEEVRCTNFMCHEQLTITLGPLINFIIGHNGSGKSAVLTALTLCLGGKATATNRGQNLKSFIKEGRENCALTVKIKNRGSSAYKPDLYGKSIIVERHFNRSGGSSFKLKDENGKIVSTKKGELEDIIDAFALQLDNPMNVLTQDNARQFLNDSNAKDKYKFFLKGTQLEGLRGEYDLLRFNTDSQQNKAETLIADIEALRKQMEVAVKKARQASTVDGMKKRERLLANQIAWARVEDEERMLHRTDAEIENVKEIINQRTNEANAYAERYNLADKAHSEAVQRKSECQDELGPVEEASRELKAKFDETKKELQTVLTTERNVIGTIRSKQKSIQNYEAQIEEHRQRQAEADNGQYAAKMQELEEAKQEMDRAKEAIEKHNASLPELKQLLKTAQEQRQPAIARSQEHRQAEQRSMTAIRDLEQGQRNWIDSYSEPRKLDQLMRMIKQNEGRFRNPPIGPLGRHIKLLKPEWGSILEKQSGASMNSFIVRSKPDQLLLSNLMKSAGCHHQHPIYIGRDAIKSALQEPDESLDTWLRVLKFDNDLVRDQMIINHSIEQAVLIRDREEAQDFMHRGGSPRRNVRFCFAMANGDNKKGHSIQISPQSGAMSINPIMEFKGRGRMQADKEPQLVEERRSLARIQKDISDTEAEVRKLDHHLNRCNRSVQDHEAQKRQLKQDFHRAQTNVDTVEAELSDATPDAGQIEQFQEALAEVQKEKEFQEGQFEDITIRKDKLNVDIRTHKTALDEATQRLANLNAEADMAQAKVDKLSAKRAVALRNKNTALEQVAAAEANKAVWEKKRQEQLVVVEENTSEAEKISARVEVPHGADEESLIRKLRTLQVEIAASEKELGGSEKELVDKALAARQLHQAKGIELAGTRTLIKAFQKSLKIRDDRWHRFKKDISRRARVTFTYLLSERQFRGDLAIDHHNKQLEIHVQPDITVASGSGRQTKTLSGGEKSFSTICLLLALWDAMGSPIRCLDEFDVFMDSVNRDISMKMMIMAARRAVGRQYILITPQAMNSVQDMADVKIHKMIDPERGQTTLNVGR